MSHEPPLQTFWELTVTRLAMQKFGKLTRTYGQYSVTINGVISTTLVGFVCECPGPGDNIHPRCSKRIKEGIYHLSTQFGRKYKSADYVTNLRMPGEKPMPGIAVMLGQSARRDGILIHPGHPPKLYLSSIGCFNLTHALTEHQEMDFQDSRTRVINLIDSLRAFSPSAFIQSVNTPIPHASLKVVDEPK